MMHYSLFRFNIAVIMGLSFIFAAVWFGNEGNVGMLALTIGVFMTWAHISHKLADLMEMLKK